MSNTCKHFYNLLKVELEDLKDDIEILEQRAAKDLENRDLSNYVYQENLVVLENEKEAVTQALKDLSSFNPVGYENISVFEDALCAHFQCQFKEKEIFPAGYELIKRKMDKLKKLLKGTLL